MKAIDYFTEKSAPTLSRTPFYMMEVTGEDFTGTNNSLNQKSILSPVATQRVVC